MKPLELQVFRKLPGTEAVYHVNGSWTPHCIVAKGKRFTDAELAAECWKADGECVNAWCDGEHTPRMQEQFETIARFATTPHFDR